MTPHSRRKFLGGTVTAGAALTLGPSFWKSALAAPAVSGPGPFGALIGPDANGLMLPPGFSSRVIARTSDPVASTAYVWPAAPDGAATFPTNDGGWILAVNSESLASNGGGVSAVRFASDGTVVDAYRILANTNGNCAGGPTPWGTWLSCEEYDLIAAPGPVFPGAPFGPGAAGQVWECDPSGVAPAVALSALGKFSHEAVAVDPSTNYLYLTEDQGNGYLYRFRPTTPNVGGRPDFTSGVLEAAVLSDLVDVVNTPKTVSWIAIPDPAGTTRLRTQVVATPFVRGEGAWFDSGVVYFTTTGDDRVWAHTPVTSTIEVVYDFATTVNPPLEDPDNITVHPATGNLFVGEDDGNFEVVVITPPNGATARQAATFLRLTGQTATELAGPCFDPSGTRMYVSSQRGISSTRGITYEITGPFDGVPPVEVPESPWSVALPVAAAVAGAAALAVRRRSSDAEPTTAGV